MTGRTDAIVVGAGVVGIAVARALALKGHEVLLLESEREFGAGTSSRNSEVIHAGLYYPQGSLKAATCVAGRKLLYDFCVARGVPHRKLGKLIFAADASQIGALDKIAAAAAAAGVDDMVRLSAQQARAMEPELQAYEALFSPSTGIIDSHAFMLAMLGEAEAHGATLVCGAEVQRVTRHKGLWQVHVTGEDAPVVAAPILINAAGLGAQKLAGMIEDMQVEYVPPLYLARGVYFTYSGKTPFSHLIYPVPEPGGLGTHLTLDMAGQARFGPDVEWIDEIDYRVNPDRLDAFATAARRIWPGLDPARLAPGYAGIRPKITGPNEAAGDFILSGPARHKCEGLVHLFGIESPGLTASLALADLVVKELP